MSLTVMIIEAILYVNVYEVVLYKVHVLVLVRYPRLLSFKTLITLFNLETYWKNLESHYFTKSIIG